VTCFSESIAESWRLCRHRKYVGRNLEIDQFIAQGIDKGTLREINFPIEEKSMYGKL
jgi:hypothetical protein